MEFYQDDNEIIILQDTTKSKQQFSQLICVRTSGKYPVNSYWIILIEFERELGPRIIAKKVLRLFYVRTLKEDKIQVYRFKIHIFLDEALLLLDLLLFWISLHLCTYFHQFKSYIMSIYLIWLTSRYLSFQDCQSLYSRRQT